MYIIVPLHATEHRKDAAMNSRKNDAKMTYDGKEATVGELADKGVANIVVTKSDDGEPTKGNASSDATSRKATGGKND